MIWLFHSKVFPQEGRKRGGDSLVAKSCPTLATPWTVAHQAPLSMGFSRQECWSGLPFPPPDDRPNPRIKPGSLTSPALAGGLFTTRATWEAQIINMAQQIGQFDELTHAEQNPRL